MKNTITIITALVVAFSLTACGGTVEDTTPAPVPAPTATTPVEPTPEPAPEPDTTEPEITQDNAPTITDDDTVIENDEDWGDFIRDAENG